MDQKETKLMCKSSLDTSVCLLLFASGGSVKTHVTALVNPVIYCNYRSELEVHF